MGLGHVLRTRLGVPPVCPACRLQVGNLSGVAGVFTVFCGRPSEGAARARNLSDVYCALWGSSPYGMLSLCILVGLQWCTCLSAMV